MMMMMMMSLRSYSAGNPSRVHSAGSHPPGCTHRLDYCNTLQRVRYGPLPSIFRLFLPSDFLLLDVAPFRSLVRVLGSWKCRTGKCRTGKWLTGIFHFHFFIYLFAGLLFVCCRCLRLIRHFPVLHFHSPRMYLARFTFTRYRTSQILTVSTYI